MFTLAFDAVNGGNVLMHVTDLSGRVVVSETMNNVSGKVNKEMNFSSLSKGVYLINLYYEGNQYTTRMVIR